MVKERLTREEAAVDPDFSLSMREKFHFRCDLKRWEFLEWLAEKLHPEMVYYAGSGSDRMPRLVFGREKVVQVSLEHTHGWHTEDFPDLGSGMKIQADFRSSPFAENAFDMVYIHDSPPEETIQSLGELIRVLKPGGQLVLDNSFWGLGDVDHFRSAVRECLNLDERMPARLTSPKHQLSYFKTWGGRWDDERRGVELVGMVESERELEEFLRKVARLRPSKVFIVPQVFEVWKKPKI